MRGFFGDPTRGIMDDVDFPTGAVPRIERQDVHEKFLRSGEAVNVVMIDIHRAHQFLLHGITADSPLFDGITVITTTTIADARLDNWSWQRELKTVLAFGSDFHVPADYPIYQVMPREKRVAVLTDYLDGICHIHTGLQKVSTKLLPRVNGITRQERERCYSVFDTLEVPGVSYYGAQYFGPHVGNRLDELVADVHRVAQEYDPDYMMLIGLQSPGALERMPRAVKAGAGQRWIDACKLRDQPPAQLLFRQ